MVVSTPLYPLTSLFGGARVLSTQGVPTTQLWPVASEALWERAALLGVDGHRVPGKIERSVIGNPRPKAKGHTSDCAFQRVAAAAEQGIRRYFP